MFRVLSAVILAFSIFVILAQSLFCRYKSTQEVKTAEKKPVSKLITVLRCLSYTFGLISFLCLLITGFVPRIFIDQMIHGHWLMVHVTMGGVFAVCVAASAILWAENNRIDKRYCRWIQKLIGRDIDQDLQCGTFEFSRKMLFWIVLFLAVIVMASILLSMFKLFGTEIQALLLNIHRYFAIALSAIVLYYTYLTFCAYKRK